MCVCVLFLAAFQLHMVVVVHVPISFKPCYAELVLEKKSEKKQKQTIKLYFFGIDYAESVSKRSET